MFTSRAQRKSFHLVSRPDALPQDRGLAHILASPVLWGPHFAGTHSLISPVYPATQAGSVPSYPFSVQGTHFRLTWALPCFLERKHCMAKVLKQTTNMPQDRSSPSWYHKERVRSRNISSLYNPYTCLPENLHRREQSTREKLWTSTSQRELGATQLLAHTRGNHLSCMCFSNANTWAWRMNV
ncbi:uncharacterized protein EI90DRAFT_851387 [Cantharellus anzutake]|uniref:uncharacterized protein n=1 Tax=Cantharellus anzutake TaxID=1750568 RepID=UPI0019081A05|nr:uncharacterized protein EI90DRAFT_851387 [Cantharellus anzutake]KAF8332360.1 hypothetical protein EI90DRAFT_851387 [Cantharellus anzutake]